MTFEIEEFDEIPTLSIDQAAANLGAVISEVLENDEPVAITTGEDSVVLVSREFYEVMEEWLILLSVPGVQEKMAEFLEELEVDEDGGFKPYIVK